MAGVPKSADRSRSCAIIILAFNRHDLTLHCVSSVRQNTKAGTYTLVVIDNGSTDEMREFDQADIVIHNTENLGFARGCNQGAAIIPEAKALVFLNNDTEVAPNWLPALLKQLKLPKVGVAGAFLHYPGGASQHCGVDFIQSPPLVAQNIRDLRPPGYVPAVTGACMAVKRDTFDAVGGFDEGYLNGYEDVDLCLRVHEEGWRVHYNSDAQAMHLESQSGPARFTHVAENEARLRARWGYLAEKAEQKTAILIPAMRPHLLSDLIINIENVTPQPYELYFMVGDDECERVLKECGAKYWRDKGGTWGRRLNFMYEHTDEPYLFCAADDVVFHPQWLRIALEVMGTMHGVVSVNDYLSREGTLPLISRQYLDYFSGCFDVPNVVIYPKYSHNYSETELYETAKRRQRFAYAAQSCVEHRHPLSGKAPVDAVYEKAQLHRDQDEALFNARAERLWRLYL